ncbi:MAG: ATP-dependent protease subunit HslV [Bacteroidetes bacterium]|nr:MAG: ATP-dependent protease subunit HslV [Bacteroidota bacterium]
MERIHGTTVLGVLHNGKVALGADGQATMGDTVVKSSVKKIRKINDGKIMVGFAGSTSDAFALLEKFDEKLNMFRSTLQRAAVELAKEWRTDRYLRRLEAMLIVMDRSEGYIISGTGDVLSPDNDVLAIGSGANYARAAALALKKHAPQLSAREMVEEALSIAADICIYTNHNFVIEEL